MQESINNQSMLKVGTILHGTYRIDSYLSSGGFGNTYVATNIEFEERVAIKEFFMKGVTQRDNNQTTVSVSNTENQNSFLEQKEKFKKEARRIRQLRNSHIVNVHDLFDENGTAYYVMDYVDGENLSERLKRTGKPMSEQEVCTILPQILDALKAVHDAGMWHLDIKPANIMVNKNGNVKLIDFGASKQLNAKKGGATTSTAISYTNGYAPREQMEQNYDKFGPWTDIYALGATLYNLLTNKRPPMPSDIDDDVSEDKHNALPFPATTSTDMKQLVVQMMQTNRMKRPQSIDEIVIPAPTKTQANKKQIPESELNDDMGEETIIIPKEEVVKPQDKKEESPKQEADLSYLDDMEETWKDKLRDFWWSLKGWITIIACVSATSILGFCIKTCDRITGWDKPQNANTEVLSETQAEPQSVDLGLSVEWASFNVGAQNPYEVGNYYWWASTTPIINESQIHDVFDYDKETNTFKKYNTLGSFLKTEDDIAKLKWGNEWRTPTPDELYELISQCKWEPAEENSVKGLYAIGGNGNKIFLPYVFSPNGSYLMGSYLSNQLSSNNVGYFLSLIFSDKSLKEIGMTEEDANLCVMEVERSSVGVVRPVKDKTTRTTSVSDYGKHSSLFVQELLKDFIHMDNFGISKIMVSQKLWKEIMGYNPSSTKNENAPVDKISWYECQTFIEQLNERTGMQFRMPTNDEWTYASTKGIKGNISEWTTSSHCFSDNNGYGKYSITRNLAYKDLMDATRVLSIKEKDLGFRLALDKR